MKRLIIMGMMTFVVGCSKSTPSVTQSPTSVSEVKQPSAPIGTNRPNQPVIPSKPTPSVGTSQGKFNKADELPEVVSLINQHGWHLMNSTRLSDGKPVVNLSVNKSGSFDHFQLTDAQVAVLAKAKTVQSLDLRYAKVTDSQLATLMNIKQINTLLLNGEDLTDEGMKHLAKCQELEELMLTGENITDAGVKELGKLAELRMLQLIGPKITGECFADFAKLPSFKRLLLTFSRGMTDAGLKNIGQLQHLDELKIGSSLGSGTYTSAGLKSVTANRVPAKFEFDKKMMDDELLSQLIKKGWLYGPTPEGAYEKKPAKPAEVRFLSLSDSQITDAGVALLDDLVNLEAIYLDNTKVTADCLKTLGQFRKLNSITMNKLTLTANHLEPIHNLPITKLELRQSNLDEGSFNSIGQLKRLERLNLDESNLKGTWLKHIVGLPSLKELSLVSTTAFSSIKTQIDLTDDDVKSIAAIGSLQRVTINYIPITNTGLTELLKLPKLESISLTGTKITTEAIAAAKKSKPRLSISN